MRKFHNTARAKSGKDNTLQYFFRRKNKFAQIQTTRFFSTRQWQTNNKAFVSFLYTISKEQIIRKKPNICIKNRKISEQGIRITLNSVYDPINSRNSVINHNYTKIQFTTNEYIPIIQKVVSTIDYRIFKQSLVNFRFQKVARSITFLKEPPSMK